MGEPFSVAGSAVGVVSLGLSICQGLITYYGQYKSFHKEINDATSHLENLDCILKVLMNTLKKGELQNASFTAEPARIAEDTIRRCDQRLRELEEMLQKCQESGISPDKISRFSKAQALYPFRRDTLLALGESVGWLQGNLENSLSLLNLSLTITDHLQITSIASISVSTHQNIESVRARMDQMESTMHIVGSQFTQQPAVLQSLLEKTEQLERDMKILTLQPYNTPKLLVKHTYPHTSSSNLSLGYPQNRTRRASKAAHGKQPHAQENDSLGFYKCLSLWKGFLDVALQMSLKFVTGASGNSINQNPRYHATVPYDSPAFALLRTMGPSAQRIRLGQRHSQLFELFRSGKASPLDKLPNGETLLSRVAAWPLLDASEIPAWRALMQSLIQCGVSPDEPTVHGSRPGHTILNQISIFHLYMWEERSVLKQEQIATCLEYLDSGGILVVFQPIIPPYPLSYVGNGIVKRGLDVISQIIGRGEFYDISDFDIPEPLIPLVLRSQNKLERLLKRGVSFQAELEFYPSWPEGLGTLLQAGYEPDKETMGRALNSGTAAVRVLKDTGKLYPELCIPFLAECPYPTAREIVVQELAEERKQLWNTALTHLPMETLLQLNIRPDTVLGFNAAQVHCLLETHGVNTNHIGSREGWLIYRAAKLNTELANQMWDHGFRDVDEKDDMGMTALMKLQSFLDFGKGPPALKLLEMASWLIKKGADGRLCPKICDYSALHFVAASLAESLGSWGWVATQSETIENLLAKMNPLSQLPSSLEAVLHSILLDDSRDSCSCYCSPTGCTPLAVFLGALTKGRNDIYYVKGIAKVILPSIFASLPSKSPESFEERVIPQALRLITFEALEISHTCAHPTYQWSILGSSDDSGITAHPAVPYAQRLVFQPFEPEEVKEIHEEEAALIEELESLVMEFISDYKRLCLPFEVFIQEHWWVRMQEVLDRQEPPTEEQIDQIQGIGVVLESQSEEGLDSETDDYLK